MFHGRGTRPGATARAAAVFYRCGSARVTRRSPRPKTVALRPASQWSPAQEADLDECLPRGMPAPAIRSKLSCGQAATLPRGKRGTILQAGSMGKGKSETLAQVKSKIE